MILEDHLEYPKYQREVHGDSEYKPNELKHVFDITTGEYTNNEFNCCHYSSADITGLTFTSDNDNIIIDDEEVIANHIGKSTITGYNGDEEKVSFKTLVYKNKPTRKLKDTILLQLNTVISIKTILKHINCPHNQDCIFKRDIFKIYSNDDLRELHYEITSIQKRINDYHNIKEAYLNGDIIYHPGLDDCYDIQIIKTPEDNGKIHHKVEVEVVKDFQEKIISRIKSSEQELKELQRIRRKIEWETSK